MDQPADTNGRHKQRRLWGPVLYLCMLLVGIFAALQINSFWRRWHKSATHPAGIRATGLPQSRQSGGLGDLGLADFPAEFAGITPLEGDPGSIAPPSGAQRRCALQRQSQDAAVELAGCDYAGEIVAAAAHYRKVLGGQGFVQLAERNVNDRLILTFQKDPTSVTVSLRMAGKKQKMVSIVLAVRRQKP